MTNIYPIRLKSSRHFLEELRLCEEGSWEDMQRQEEETGKAERPTKSHTVAVIDRSPATVLVIRNREELHDVRYALVSGTIGLHALRAANTMLEKLDEPCKVEGIDLGSFWGTRNDGM